jgi:rhodanese-related sulfurtransferase|tara:strand:- start:2973 stop:3266 length:294 start_codon:yes stop_codon:yes gene_type:complete
MADSITKNELKENISQYIVIDVRETDELENGKIENSLSMPLGLVIRNIKQGKIEDLKSKKICTYCASGYRGNIASDELSKSGFTSVNLDGGFKAWVS